MQTLANGSPAPRFRATDLDGNPLDLLQALGSGPVIVVFGHPQINASRLVIGYLRRLPEMAPTVPVWVFLQSNESEARKYVGAGDSKYLEMPVVLDQCQVANQFEAKFLPTTYLIGQDGTILHGYTGFNKDFLNLIANKAAELTGGKQKELIADGDNKGALELAERGPCA